MGAATSSTKYTQSYHEDEDDEHSEITSELKTLPDFLRHRALSRPDGDAVVFVSPDGTREAVTWKQWYDNATRVAKSLVALGLKEGECVAVALRPCPEFLFVTYGAMMAGAVPVAVSFTYKDGSDFIAMMEKLQTVSAVVLDSGIDGTNLEIFKRFVDCYDKCGHAASEQIPYLRHCIYHGDDESEFMTIEQLMMQTNDDVILPEIKPDVTAVLFQTSGSTGVPKAVAHTHASLAYLVHKNKLANEHTNSDEEDQKASPGSKMFNDRPFNWIGGFPLNVLMGETRVTRSRVGRELDLEERIQFIIDTVKREKCATFTCLPQFLRELMDKQDLIGNDWPVKAVIVGGQPISRQFAECLGKLCVVFGCSYGGTELMAIAAYIVTDPGHFSDYCCGYPIKGVALKIVDENGDIVPVGTQGEIYIRSKGLFKEYYNDAEKTRLAFTSDGWYRTDDLGHMTDTGMLYVEGRKSEMIISGAMNVLPSILEDVLSSCPGVNRAVCVPIPHETMYQVVCACIKRESGSNITEEELRAYCEDVHNDRSRMFTVVPRYFLFMDDFCQTRSGKVSRKEIAKEAERVLAGKV